MGLVYAKILLRNPLDASLAAYETNAMVDEFGSGRQIVPSGTPDINGDRMYWEWTFADTGEAAYQIEIERIVPAEPELTEIQQMKVNIEDGDTIIEAFEKADLETMDAEGDGATAAQIRVVLSLVDVICAAAEVNFE